MNIYSFQVTTGRKDGFLRIYHVRDTATLYDFRRFIENDLDFDDSQPGVFWCLNTNGNKTKQYSLFDTGDGAMDTVTIKKLYDDGIMMMLYTFDFYNNRSLIIEFTGTPDIQPRKSYPLIFESKGEAPGQFEEKPVEEPLPKVGIDQTGDGDEY